MPSLFRPEVIEGRQQAWLGSIQLVRPVPLAVLTLMVVIIAGAVGGFLLEGRYTRKAHIAGYLVPDRGVLRLLPPQAGVVTESHVVEGRAVRRGDVLFVLSIDRATLSGDTQAAVQASLAVRAQLQALSRQRAAHLREIGTLEAQRRELPLRSMAAMGEIERDLASLAQESAENEAKQRVVIRAPQDGVVTAVLAEPGHSVSPASALASLLPADARLQAQLFAPSSAVGFVRANQQVQLRYQAFPYQKFGHHAGQVLQVSRTPL